MLEPLDFPALVLSCARVLPLGVALAVLSRGLVPAGVALSLCLPLGLALGPHAGGLPAMDAAPLALALLRELCLGAAFALAVALALLPIPWAVGVARSSVPPALGGAYGRYACWLALALGAPRALLIGLAESYRDAPVAAQLPAMRPFALGIAQLVTDALATALGVGLPLWLLALAMELGLGLAVRAVAAPTEPLALVRPLLATALTALLLVPVAAKSPELVRAAIEGTRALTRALVQ